MDWHETSPLDQISHESEAVATPAAVYAAGLAQHNIANTAYPIGHLTTMRPYKVPRSQVQETAPLAWEGIKYLGLYAHIPFCEARCSYCEYTVVDPVTIRESEDRYFDLLMAEIALYRQAIDTQAKRLVGFDIGGGTPSVAKNSNIDRLVQAAQDNFKFDAHAAISIETTPKIAAAEPEKIRAYYAMGIRRISMGVQTINPRLLQELGRTATSLVYNRQAAEHIRQAGFQRFNVDIMYGFAHQSLRSLEATLKHVISLEPDYITLYRTRYKGTRIASQAQYVTLAEVNAQARLAKEMLHAAGYAGTAGKNTFSRLPGDVGTSEYLTSRVIYGLPYLGLGLGAQSLSNQTLAYNSGAADKRLGHYQRQVLAGELPIQDLYHLSLPAAMGKMISVSFYFGEINLNAFQHKFGLTLEQAFPGEVAFVLDHGLMKYTTSAENAPGTTLRLTPAGEGAYNGVIALFYAGAVKQHVLALNAEQPHAASPDIPLYNGQIAQYLQEV